MAFGGNDGGKTTIWTRGSETVLNFVHAAKKRRRTLVIVSIALTVVACLVAVGVVRYLNAQAADRIVVSNGALTGCLFGGELAAEESASVRFRAIQLGALADAELSRASGERAWPEICAAHAHDLHAALKSGYLDGGSYDALIASTQALATALEEKGSYFADLSGPLDKAIGDLRAANLASGPADGAKTPQPAAALNVDTIGDSSRLSAEQLELGALVTEPHRSGTIRWLATADSRIAKPAICTVRADKATCAAYPKSIAEAAAAGLSFAGTADEEGAALIAAKKGTQGIFRSDNGKGLEPRPIIGAYASVDGRHFALTVDGDRLDLVRSEGEDTKKSSASPGFRRKLAHASLDAQLLFGHVLYASVDEEQFALAAAPLDDKRGLGEVEEVGALGKEPAKETAAATLPRIDGCHSAQTTVARTRVARHSYVSFRLANKWTTPVQAGAAGGALTCHRKEAVITQIGSQGGTALTSTITQHVCSPTACKTQTAVMSDVLAGEGALAPKGKLSVVGLAGKALVVWHAAARGGVRMRLATVPNLQKTPDVILFDDHIADGAVTAQPTVLTVRVLPAEDFAVVLLNTQKGVFALRVAADGKVTPLQVGG